MFESKNILIYILIAVFIFYFLSNKMKESFYVNKICIGNTCIYENDLKAFVKHGDSITIRSQKTGRRLQDAANNYAIFDNFNRGAWEKMHIEKCGHNGIGHTDIQC